MSEEEKENFSIEKTLNCNNEWKLELLDESVEVTLEHGEPEKKEHWLEVELTIGHRWGDHLTMCFDGAKKDTIFGTDATMAVKEFSEFVDACVEMREKMIDAAIQYQQKNS